MRRIMNEILKKLNTGRFYMDGGLGTMLQSCGLKGGEAPELWSISHPDILKNIHRQYLAAGCDAVTANTFGVNCDKYDNYRELITAAVGCAKEAASEFDNRFVALDIGPTGRLMKPLGDMEFEEAVGIFSKTAKAGKEAGADFIIIETMNDCFETKAAVLGAKESCDLPVFVSNAYDISGKLMTGADPLAMIAMLEGLGVDALGLNCSFGPDVVLNIIPDFIENSSVPIIAMPNAGLPRVENGSTVYDISPDDFSDYMVKLAQAGVSVLGGCCGTTPDYIKKTIEKTRSLPYSPIAKKQDTVVSSYTHGVKIGNSPILIGERINPTGKSKLKEALRQENLGYILGEAVSQAEAGAHILDVNVGLPEIDEVKMLSEVTAAVQSVSGLPLQLDSTDPTALAAAMRIYGGKPLINSVNGERESMDKIFPLIKKYGGSVIALTMDKSGIPETAEGRLEIAKRILSRAKDYGIEAKDIIFDPLCLTVSSNPLSAVTTLKAVELLKNAGYKTSLGVSNISFGLPAREKINTAFFAQALQSGLDCAIMNPKSNAMMDVYYAHRVLHGLDANCLDYISYACADTPQGAPAKAVSEEMTLIKAIVKGLKNDSARLCAALLKSAEPLGIVNEHIIPALNDIGRQFEEKKAYLPQLLMSAEAATAAFAEVKAAIPMESRDDSKTVILATVKGDIHDIGKNIVRVMLESYGFKVYDLGRDVDPQVILDTSIKTGCRLIGLSALMTTTVPSMEATIKLLKQHFKDEVKTVVGGAVLNREYADMIGADFYAKDAMDTVRFAQEYYKAK